MADIISKDVQIKEIIECGKNPAHFMMKYVKIQHSTKGTIPFELFDFQKDVIKDYQKHRLNIVLKSRQLGLSTVTAAYALWLALFRRDKNIVCIATKLDTAVEFMDKVRVAFNALPKWLILKPKVGDSKQSIKFGNGSQIRAIPRSESAGRGMAASLIIIDEAAHIENFEKIWAALLPALSTGGSAILLSSPNGANGVFYETYVDAVSKKNDFNPIELKWDVHPERDDKWEETTRKMYSARYFAQEFACVAENSRIVTYDGYKFVEDIEIGDRVLTHKGNFKEVIKINKRPIDQAENVWEISSPGNRRSPVIMTGNHPVYMTSDRNVKTACLLQDDEMWEFRSIDSLNEQLHKFKKTTRRSRFHCGLMSVLNTDQFADEIKQIDLSTLVESTIISDDIIKYPRQWNMNKRYVDVDYDLGKFIGLYLAEGSITKANKAGQCTQFGLHADEATALGAWLISYMEGLGARVRQYNHRPLYNTFVIQTHNHYIAKLCRKFINDSYAPEKTLNMDLIMSTNIEFVKGLVEGWILGDGTHSPEQKIVVTSASPQLLYQMRTLLSIFSCYPRIHHVNNTPYCLEINNVDYRTITEVLNENKYLVKSGSRSTLVTTNDKNKVFAGHVNVTKSDYAGYVYNFKVQDDNSYIVESLIVHNCDFLGSGDTFVAGEDIQWLKSLVVQPIRKDGPQNQIWIWKDSIKEHAYAISADVARGDSGGDFSTFHIFDTGENEVVAEYMGHIRPDEFGKLLDIWGRKYNNALMSPEQNTYGHHTITVLQHRDYPNFYYEQMERDPHFYPSADDIPGYNNQGKKKRNDLLANMEGHLRNKTVKSYSSRLVHQLQSFIWTQGNTAESEGKAQARKGQNDDLIMSFAIGLKIINASNIDETARAMAYAILNSTHRTNIHDTTTKFTSKEFAKAAEELPNNAHPHSLTDRGPTRVPDNIKKALRDISWLYR